MKGMGNMMKQAQKLQSQMLKLQEEMAEVVGNYLLFIAALYTPQTVLAVSSAEYRKES